MRIKQLPPEIANQIAAGEVIERPASCIKELLENAKDANATEIRIEIRHGGLVEMSVSDNGDGIVREDLPLAVTAFATSKISSASDLEYIQTMGFRGEALASMAAVSKLSIVSKTNEAEHATMIEGHGSDFRLSLSPRACGTTVSVCDLFFNAPVRKKFLKSPRIEFQAIEMVVRAFLFSAPHIGLILMHDGRVVWSFPQALTPLQQKMRIQKLLGKSFIEHAVEATFDEGILRGTGYVGLPSCHRSQNDRIFLLLNGRMVKDRLLMRAVRQAYEGLLYPGRYPVCVLDLKMDHRLIDVNVHPSKYEVRFDEPRIVHDTLFQRLRNLLTTESVTSSVAKPILTQKKSKSNLFEKSELISKDVIQLNERFLLMEQNEDWYVVDGKKLFYKMLSYELNEANFPLESRDLLVPMHVYPNASITSEIAKEVILTAKEAGILLNWDSDACRFKVLSLPIVLPSLNIKRFIHELFLKKPQNKSELLEHLMNATDFIFHEHAASLSHFFKSGISKDICECARQLTLESCTNWFKMPQSVYTSVDEEVL